MSGTSPATIIHNARIQLSATLFNTVAGSSCAIGVLTPIAAVFFYSAAPAGLRLGAITIGIAFWLAAFRRFGVNPSGADSFPEPASE